MSYIITILVITTIAILIAVIVLTTSLCRFVKQGGVGSWEVCEGGCQYVMRNGRACGDLSCSGHCQIAAEWLSSGNSLWDTSGGCSGPLKKQAVKWRQKRFSRASTSCTPSGYLHPQGACSSANRVMNCVVWLVLLWGSWICNRFEILESSTPSEGGANTYGKEVPSSRAPFPRA